MADISFFDQPGQTPRPRAEIRVEELALKPYPDGRRVQVTMRLTPFGPADRPNINIAVHNDAGEEVASMSIIETMHYSLGVTVHLRGEQTSASPHTVSVDLFYEPGTIHDSHSATFTPPQP